MINCYCGIPDIIILWHGEWADPEVCWNGLTRNYYDLDEILWERYVEECRENGTTAEVDLFPAWVKKNAETAIGLLQDMAMLDDEEATA